MPNLDEDLTYEVTYRNDCRGTYEQYKHKYVEELTANFYLLLVVIGGIILYYFCFDNSFGDREYIDSAISAVGLVGILNVTTQWFLIYAKNITVQKTIFYSVKQTRLGSDQLRFKDIPPIRDRKKEFSSLNIPTGTEVLVVQTKKNGRLLDIVPVSTIRKRIKEY